MSTNRKKVLVPHTMGRAGTDILKARDDIDMVVFQGTISQEDFRPLLTDAAGVALSSTAFRQAEMDAAPVMQVVARIGVGYDAVEVPALTARGVPLLTAGTANSVSVAEHAMFMMLALAKRGRLMDNLVRDDRWNDRHHYLPYEIAEKTVLVVGYGRIGTRSAKRAAAMEMNVLVYDPYVPAASIAAAGYEAVSDLDAALPRADFVTIHCPKNPETVGMFNAARFARMKKGVFVVNTARGGIIDEQALHDALVSGHVAGAGLDVYATEPAPMANKLLALDTVISTPHMAGVTAEAVQAMAAATARNILSVLDGKPNRENVINKEVLGE
ncbi:MAG: hydroxyacid dehydrogenase [Rhodospirillales bacterium]|nr:hydroxyacid dehydrogenase [Rhodospirillales bacterium]